jgi:hypothetical protein
MKRIFASFLFIFVFSTLVSAQEKLFAKVESVTGKVEIYKENSWRPLTAGTTLSKGDIISTGFNSEAVVSIKDSSVKLSALTRMTVEQLTENDKKEKTQLFIDSGKITASVKHAENKRTDFKVRSPVSTASVRGTNFTFFAIGRIATLFGLVSTSPSTSLTAQVADSDSLTDFSTPEGESSVFTDTSDVGDSYGTPVYEGQETSTDFLTGQVIPTQLSMIAASQTVGGFTANTGSSIIENATAVLSNIASNSGNSTNSGGTDNKYSSENNSTSVTPTPSTASLNISLTLKQ